MRGSSNLVSNFCAFSVFMEVVDVYGGYGIGVGSCEDDDVVQDSACADKFVFCLRCVL